MSRSDAYEIAYLRGLVYTAGICPDCGEEMSHDVEEPFAHCKCGTTEDTIGPSIIQKLRMRVKELETKYESVATKTEKSNVSGVQEKSSD